MERGCVGAFLFVHDLAQITFFVISQDNKENMILYSLI